MVAKTPADVIAIFSKGAYLDFFCPNIVRSLIMQCIYYLGSARRATASTQMNAESSRSHLICSLVVKLTNRRTSMQSIGKLTLVDLAGSEVGEIYNAPCYYIFY